LRVSSRPYSKSQTNVNAKDVFGFNSLTGKREKLVPQVAGQFSVYGCGPTVYGLTHVGNARAALTVDLVTRVLELAGYKVKLARNITDIDDKIIKVAAETQSTFEAVVKKFTASYQNELKILEIRTPEAEPTATQSINEIYSFIKKLVDTGAAYPADTPFGTDVYFRVHKFSEYGKLSKRKTEDLKVGVRIEPGETKEDPLDFALWKAAKPGEPSWKSPWGEGRPGWHIECSAMIEKIFGDTLDIHMGGIDLIFPHHENEIAQSESCHHKPLARYWIHNGMLTLGREKMSKSLGNIFTTHSFLEIYGPEVLRLMCLQHHYRAPMDFSEESIVRAEALLERLYRGKLNAEKHAGSAGNHVTASQFKDLQNVENSIFDDFNSAKSLGFVLSALRVCFRENKPELWSAWWNETRNLFEKVFVILNLNAETALMQIRGRKLKRLGISDETAREIDAALEQRESLRKEKKFQEADQVRIDLESKGFLVMDGPDGSSWSVPDKQGSTN
jgi:cysteinyl-tRNA synthetase